MNKNDQTNRTAPLTKRQKKILEMIQRDGYVKVIDLSRVMDVAEITIRRDLDMMERHSLLERTHGGAISTKRIYQQTSYKNRSDLELEHKDEIGRAAARFIEDGDTVFINGGSTTFHVFRYITSRNVKIVTTNAGCFDQLMAPEVELVLAGGHYHVESNAFYGGFTNDIIHQIVASKAIIGVHGISCKYGLTTPLKQAAETTRNMIERTRGEVIVVADHRKIGIVSDYVTVPTHRISTLITDRFTDSEYIEDFEGLGIKVIQTSLE